jgi:hypothetical protein
VLTERIDPRVRGLLPDPWGFSEVAPGLSYIMQLSARLRRTIALMLDNLVLFRIVSLTQNPDAKIFGSLLVLSLALICLPANAVGGAGDFKLKRIVLPQPRCILIHY